MSAAVVSREPVVRSAPRRGRVDWVLPVAMVLAALVLHACSSGALDLFRDELYFVVCGARPQWGYVDQPPLVPLVAYASYVVAHGNPLLFRIVPALAHAATALAAMALVAACGGGRFARVLAGLAIVVAPVYALFGWLLTTNVIEPLCWTLVLLAAIRARIAPRAWLLAGLALGLAFETKYGLLPYLPGLAIGLSVTSYRVAFARRTFWLGALAAAALTAPGVAWQAAHGFPMLELLHDDAIGGKNTVLSPLAYLASEALLVGPLGAVLLVAGFATLWPGRRPPSEGDRAARASSTLIVVGWLVTFVVMLATHAKDYYFAAADRARSGRVRTRVACDRGARRARRARRRHHRNLTARNSARWCCDIARRRACCGGRGYGKRDGRAIAAAAADGGYVRLARLRACRRSCVAHARRPRTRACRRVGVKLR